MTPFLCALHARACTSLCLMHISQHLTVMYSVCACARASICVCDLEELMMQEEQYQSAAPQRLPLDELMTHFLTRWQEV